jgi:hypothetical protein
MRADESRSESQIECRSGARSQRTRPARAFKAAVALRRRSIDHHRRRGRSFGGTEKGGARVAAGHELATPALGGLDVGRRGRDVASGRRVST